MKTVIKFFALAVVISLSASGCRDKAAEKRVAELEARINELEAGKAAPDATPFATSTPEAVAEVKPEGPLGDFKFATVNHDFGTINEGDKVEFTYKFENSGSAPLIIENAVGSCGCTVPDWSKGAVAPGESGFVKAVFDSNGKKGFQTKTVTVTANTFPKQVKLEFKANVLPKEGSK